MNESELTTVDDDPDSVDASQDDHLVEQTDNSGEPETDDTPQGADEVEDDPAEDDGADGE